MQLPTQTPLTHIHTRDIILYFNIMVYIARKLTKIPRSEEQNLEENEAANGFVPHLEAKETKWLLWQ
jgi:hypothetical protein